MRTELGSLRARLRGFGRNRNGVAGIEFALLVPVLLILYLGTVDVCVGFTLHRKVVHAASMMSDLVTRETSVTKSDLQGIFDAGDAAVAPRAAKLDSAKISAVYVDATGKATIKWSRARVAAADTVGSPVALPSDLAGFRNINLIRTNVSYLYHPLGGFGLTKAYRIEQELYNASRTGNGVACSDC
jgi:Flp pilus assembly protein TadG